MRGGDDVLFIDERPSTEGVKVPPVAVLDAGCPGGFPVGHGGATDDLVLTMGGLGFTDELANAGWANDDAGVYKNMLFMI